MRRAVLGLLALALAGCASTWPSPFASPAASMLERADALVARGDYAGAVAAYDELLARYPSDGLAGRALASRDTAATIIAAREEIARLRAELEAREGELRRVRQELQRLTAESDRLRADLEHLKRIDLKLERR